MQIRDNFPDLFRSTALPFLKNVSFGEYDTFKAKWPRIFPEDTTTRDLEQFTEVSGLGSYLPITEGGDVQDDAPVQGFKKTYDPVRYGRSFRISQDHMEADRWNWMARMSKSLAKKGRIHQELLGAAIFNRAFDSNYLGPDGVELCSTLHPLVKSGGYQSNKAAAAADLDPSSLEEALIEFEMQRDHTGDLIHVPCATLLVAANNRFNAAQILHSTMRSDTANNATNPLRYAEDGLPTQMVWKYLTDVDTWFLLAPPEDTGLLWLWRRKLYSKSWIEDRSETAVYAMRYKADVGWHRFYGVYGVQGA